MVPRRARIQGSQTFVSQNSRLESNKEEEEDLEEMRGRMAPAGVAKTIWGMFSRYYVINAWYKHM